MKEILVKLNPAFDHRNRLAIMSLLVTNERIDYNTLRQTLDLTDGNLASHLKTLEESEFIKFQKGFIGRKTNTTYSITKNGEKEFKLHLDALTKMIGSVK